MEEDSRTVLGEGRGGLGGTCSPSSQRCVVGQAFRLPAMWPSTRALSPSLSLLPVCRDDRIASPIFFHEAFRSIRFALRSFP